MNIVQIYYLVKCKIFRRWLCMLFCTLEEKVGLRILGCNIVGFGQVETPYHKIKSTALIRWDRYSNLNKNQITETQPIHSRPFVFWNVNGVLELLTPYIQNTRLPQLLVCSSNITSGSGLLHTQRSCQNINILPELLKEIATRSGFNYFCRSAKVDGKNAPVMWWAQ